MVLSHPIVKRVSFALLMVLPLFAFTSNNSIKSDINTDLNALSIDGFKVVKGDRPPINLEKVSKESYEEGKIYIKLNREVERSIAISSKSEKKGEFVKTGNSSLDLLNAKYRANEYTPLFEGLYQIETNAIKANSFRERHQAWGFHLWYEIKLDDKTDIIDAVKAFQALPEVELAEPVYKIELVGNVDNSFEKRSDDNASQSNQKWTPNDPRLDEQWHYHNTGQQAGTAGKDISMFEAWEIETGHTDVIVAIIDDGIQYDHPDIEANMWPEIGYNFVTNSSTVNPGNHGTHVAGTIAAVNDNNVGVAGVAGGSGSGDGVRLMSAQVFSGGSSGGFHLAPIYAADNGAAISQNSWGYTSAGYYNQNVLDAIDYFNENGGGDVLDGGITIFAAGNSNASGQWYPGYYSGAMSVAGTNNQDQKSWYSNYDTWIDISAPGGETNSVNARGVLSTVTGSSYAFYQGTSMACPHVSGVAALLISYAYRNGVILSNTELWELLVDNTDDHYAQNPSFTGMLGSGRLNAEKALLALNDFVSGVMNPSNFEAIGVSSSQIDLSWTKNNEGNSVMVVWSSNNTFGSPVDGQIYSVGSAIPGGGTVLYRGSATNHTHEDLFDATMYYYRAFSYNSANDYSSGRTTSAATLCDVFEELPFIEDFNASNQIPICWDVLDNQGNGQVWQFGTHSNGLSGTTGNYAFLNSDAFGSGNSQNADLVTPVFDFSRYSDVIITFNHYFRSYSGSSATLLYSIDGGGSWESIQQWTSTTSNPATFNQTISEVAGQSNVRFKWNYTGTWGYYWDIDDVEISGTLIPQTYLAINIEGSGHVLVDGNHYDSPIEISQGNLVELEAVPQVGWEFDSWSGDLSSVNPSESIIMDDDKNIEAIFNLKTFVLQYDADENGSIEGEASQVVDYNTNGTAVTAIPNVGYHFVQWSDGVTSNPRIDVDIQSNISVTAEFEINTYTLRYFAGPNGTLDGEVIQEVQHGSDASSVLAVPDSRYHFVQWSDGSTDNPRTDTGVESSINVTAEFEINTYTLTLNITGDGLVDVNGDIYSEPIVFTEGTLLNLEALPDDGWRFEGWSGDLVSLNQSEIIEVNDDLIISVTFTEIPIYTLTVELEGSGTTTLEAGEHEYREGTVIDLFAFPSAAYEFEKWLIGSDESLSQSYQLEIEDDVVVKAFFVETLENQFTLSIETVGSGSTNPPEGSIIYNENSTVSLIATPDTGWDFAGWSGSLSSSNNTETITIDEDKNVTATFTIKTFSLSYTAQAQGSIDGESNQIVDYGSNGAPVEAVPNAGYHFVKWSDGLIDNPRTDEEVTASLDVMAEFAINVYSLKYYAGSYGILEGKSSQNVEHGSNGSAITIVPFEGYEFVNWSDGVTSNPRTDINVSSPIEVTAQYEPITYSLSYTADENGTIEGESSQAVQYGASGTAVTAMPNEGYYFLRWSDGKTSNPRKDISINGPIDVTAEFELNVYVLAYSADNNGNIQGESYQAVYHGNDGNPVTAEPKQGYHFTHWSDGVEDNPRKDLGITGPISVSASFALNIYTLSYSSGENGVIEGQTEQNLTHGSDGTAIEAIADYGYHFVKWSDGVTQNPRVDKNVSSSLEVTAEFTINVYTLKYSAQYGTIEGDASQSIEHGSSGSPVKAIANEHYEFNQWSDGITDNPRTDIEVESDLSVQAEFTINTYTITISLEGNGYVSVNGETYQQPITLDANSDITLQAIADEDWEFAKWEGDLDSENATESISLDSDKSITVYFTEIPQQYQLTLFANPEFAGEVDGEGFYLEGEEVTIKAIANEGYFFNGWQDEQENVLSDSPEYSFEMPSADLILTAEFIEEPVFYNVTFEITNEDEQPIEGAIILIDSTHQLTTNQNGLAAIQLQNGTYTFDLSANGYDNHANSFTVADDDEYVAVQMQTVSSDVIGLNSIEVYPNPFSSTITINNAQGATRAIITSLIGRTIKEVYLGDTDSHIIFTDDLSKGFYIITVEGKDGELKVIRMVKE